MSAGPKEARPPKLYEEHDGLFPRADWLRWLADAGFEALCVPVEHSELEPGSYEVFVAHRPG